MLGQLLLFHPHYTGITEPSVWMETELQNQEPVLGRSDSTFFQLPQGCLPPPHTHTQEFTHTHTHKPRSQPDRTPSWNCLFPVHAWGVHRHPTPDLTPQVTLSSSAKFKQVLLRTWCPSLTTHPPHPHVPGLPHLGLQETTWSPLPSSSWL